MRLRTRFNIILTVLLILTACQASLMTQPKQTLRKVTATYPRTEISLPAKDFTFLFPVAAELAEMPKPRKEINADFTARERSVLAVPDAKRFKDSNTEIIDLSLITKDEYAFPLPGGKIISPYAGRRRHHSGVDIKTFPNDTIVAAFDGIVRMSQRYAAYGNLIAIRHYNGLETVYSHNSKNLVKPGTFVKAGQPIALCGRTGRATTEHLHFEIRINGQHFNPNLVFNLHNQRLHHKYLVCTLKGGKVNVKALYVLPHQRQGSYNRFAQNNKQEEVNSE